MVIRPSSLAVLISLNNIVEYCDNHPHYVIDYVSYMLNEDPLSIITALHTKDDLLRAQKQLALFSNMNGWLTPLWAKMKHVTDKTQRERIAMRDFLEATAAMARQKWEAVSRNYTIYQGMVEETRMDNGIRR